MPHLQNKNPPGDLKDSEYDPETYESTDSENMDASDCDKDEKSDFSIQSEHSDYPADGADEAYYTTEENHEDKPVFSSPEPVERSQGAIVLRQIVLVRWFPTTGQSNWRPR